MAKIHVQGLTASQEIDLLIYSSTQQSVAAVPRSSLLYLVTRTGLSNQVHQSPLCNFFGPHRIHHSIPGPRSAPCCVGRAVSAAHRSGAWQPQAAPGWTRPAACPPRASPPDHWVPLLFHRSAAPHPPPPRPVRCLGRGSCNRGSTCDLLQSSGGWL